MNDLFRCNVTICLVFHYVTEELSMTVAIEATIGLLSSVSSIHTSEDPMRFHEYMHTHPRIDRLFVHTTLTDTHSQSLYHRRSIRVAFSLAHIHTLHLRSAPCMCTCGTHADIYVRLEIRIARCECSLWQLYPQIGDRSSH